MFSADTTLHSFQSGRNPRRRHRVSEEDNTGTGGLVPAKRRKRSSISGNTFEPPTIIKANGNAVPSTATSRAREETPELEHNSKTYQNGSIEKPATLVVRNRSSRLSRQSKPTRHDEGVLLVKTDRYQVAKETNVPDEVQDVIRAKEPWQAFFNEELGQVVLTTHYKAVVWRYAQGNSAEGLLRTAVIKFQNAASKPKDPLPCATLLKDTGAGELALLVIRAGGKVIYWESVASAANADILRQKQNGLYGTIHGLISGEHIVDIQEAEADGFVLTTNAGRVLHLAIRDSQGKSLISTELLRTSPSGGGGVLGSLRNVFIMSGLRNDVASVKCVASRTKGHRKCLVITKQGIIQIWDFARQSSKTLEAEIDAKELVLKSAESIDGPIGELQILDATLPSSKKQQLDASHILLLVAVRYAQKWSYSLLDATLEKEAFRIHSSYPINVWSQAPDDGKPWLASHAQLLVPDPGHTALIMLDNAIIAASLTPSHKGPDAQLQDENEPKADAWQDVLYLAKERDYSLVGCAIEPASQSEVASALFFVNEYGLANVAVNKSKETETVQARRANQCKAKIEQVVFFADVPNKLFDFQRAMPVADWSAQEVEAAALQINSGILDSSSAYVPDIAPSMDHQLKDRSAYLKALAKFVSRWELSAATRWTLLWSAEKMVAARAVWQAYTVHLAKRDEQKIPFRGRNTVLLWEALDSVHERYKHDINPEKGENDIVRQFLTRDIVQLDLLVAWSAKAIEQLAIDNVTNTVHHAWLISQASDIVKAALDTAFKFREYNAAFYGFAPELFEDGIYRGDYKGLAAVWTSCREICLTVPDLARYAQQVATNLSNHESSDEEGPELEEDDLIKLVEDAVSLARLTCQIYDEGSLNAGRKDGPSRTEAFKAASQDQRRELLVGLVDLMVPDEGMKLAEKHRDLLSLAEIACRSKAFILERLDDGVEEERTSMEKKLQEYEARINKYFRDYGMNWAQAFYSQLMKRESISGVLKTGGQSLPEYLNRNPSLIKAKWMYDVGHQQAYKGAVHDLLRCNTDESNLWNKKVQLSLAKLSLLAAQEQGQTTQDTATKQMRHADRRLTTIEIQDNVYNYTHPHLRSALDQYASVELAMETFGKSVKKTNMQAAVFKESIEKLVSRRWVGEENLIDMLTLIHCPADLVDDAHFAAHRFFFALQTLRDNPSWDDKANTSLLQSIIWRRVIIQDDWSEFNITELKSDEEVAREAESTALFKTLLAGFHDGLLESDLPPPHNPESLLGTGSTPDELRGISRWANLDDATIFAMAADYAAEDLKLREMIEKGRLALWWQGIISAARTELHRRLNTADTSESSKGKANGTSAGKEPVGVNGHASEESAAEDLHGKAQRDNDGDIEMG